MNQNLPGYVVMLDPRGGPISGAANWSSGYMPAAYQGTVFRSSGQPILDLASAPAHARDSARPDRHRQRPQCRSTWPPVPAIRSCRPGSPATNWPFSCRRRRPRRSTCAQESEQTREMYGLNDPAADHPLAVGPAPFAPAVPDRPAAGRARRAVRADLPRRRPSAAELGRPQRRRREPRKSIARKSTSRSPAC